MLLLLNIDGQLIAGIWVV